MRKLGFKEVKSPFAQRSPVSKGCSLNLNVVSESRYQALPTANCCSVFLQQPQTLTYLGGGLLSGGWNEKLLNLGALMLDSG